MRARPQQQLRMGDTTTLPGHTLHIQLRLLKYPIERRVANLHFMLLRTRPLRSADSAYRSRRNPVQARTQRRTCNRHTRTREQVQHRATGLTRLLTLSLPNRLKYSSRKGTRVRCTPCKLSNPTTSSHLGDQSTSFHRNWLRKACSKHTTGSRAPQSNQLLLP